MSRKNTRNTSTKKPSPSSSLSEDDQLPGVDLKNQGPRSTKHQRLDLNTANGESRFLSSVQKELSKKSNINKLQNAFQQQSLFDDSSSASLASKTVKITNQNISINVSSPLDGVSAPTYIQKWKNPDLIKEIPVTFEEEDAAGSTLAKEARPSVMAVNLKWKNGIELKQCHKFTTRTTQLEPLMRKTEFDFESKTKFASQVESACDDLFLDWKQRLMILDGNECHGQFTMPSSTQKTTKAVRSDKLQQDNIPAQPYADDEDSNTKEWKEYTDLQEHKILVIPFNTKNGFDKDDNKRYQFPYQAKFVFGRKAYHHKFYLQLPVTRSPQHYGLIFTFSEDPKGHSKVRIKSLITVYSIHPETHKYAVLETYENDQSLIHEQPQAGATTRSKGQSAKAAKNAVQLLSDNLKEEKLVSNVAGSGNFQMSRDLAQAGDSHYRHRRLDDESMPGKKQKKKQQVMRNIKMEQARY